MISRYPHLQFMMYLLIYKYIPLLYIISMSHMNSWVPFACTIIIYGISENRKNKNKNLHRAHESGGEHWFLWVKEEID